MSRDVRALLRQKLTGDDIGRLLIEDLVISYHHAAYPDDGNPPPFTEAEKTALVESLSKPAEIDRYTEYRYVHEVLINAQTTTVLQLNAMEAMFGRLYPPLDLLRVAEMENDIQRRAPRIMTQSQYEAAKAAGTLPSTGAAVLIEEAAAYTPGPTYLFQHFSAEPFLEKYDGFFQENYLQYQDFLRTFYAARCAVALIGEYINLPQVETLIPPSNEALFEDVNAMLLALPRVVVRDDPTVQEALRARLRVFCPPVALDTLKPTEAQIEAARGQMDFSCFHGNMQKLYTLLTREANVP